MDQVLEADDENKTQSLTLSMYKLHPLSYNWFILCQDYDAYICIPFVAVEQGEELQVQVMQCLRRQQIHLAAGWLEEALSGSTRSTHTRRRMGGCVKRHREYQENLHHSCSRFVIHGYMHTEPKRCST